MREDVIYLDNAATSLPKAPGVAEAMARYMAEVGASAGRGRYALAQRGAEIIHEARERLAQLIGANDPSRIIFTLNGTDALHLTIAGVVRQRRRTRPDAKIHIITTALDHNSVLRPLSAFGEDGVETSIIEPDRDTGVVMAEMIAREIRDDTALVAVVHASNVTGALQPAAEIAAVCRRAGVPMLLDAAQSAGHVPIDMTSLGVTMLAMPGHKGLLGPLGTGVLVLAPGVEEIVATVREGGTGNWSESDRQPSAMPTKYEAGSHNAVGIAGLSAGVQWLLDRGVASLREHERRLTAIALARLAAMAGQGVRILGSVDPAVRVGVVSFTHDHLSPEAIAERLEHDHGVLVRAGVHCAPRAHQWLGTLDGRDDMQGAVRMSFGPFLSESDIGRACDAVEAVVGDRRGVTVVGVRRAVSLPDLRP